MIERPVIYGNGYISTEGQQSFDLDDSDEEEDFIDHTLNPNILPDEGFRSASEEEQVFIVPKPTFREILAIPSYPFFFAKTLIQIGYEPLPPYRAKSLFGFGPTRMYLPGAFTYVRYIYTVDGFSGLFRGLGCYVASGLAHRYTSGLVQQFAEDRMPHVPPDQHSAVAKFARKTAVDVVSNGWAVLASQPFYVMALRCVAQFVGGETKYSSFNVFANAGVIYSEEGIQGFFAGLVPRLCLEVSTVLAFNALVESGRWLTGHSDGRNKGEGSMDNFRCILARLLVTSLTYPLALISTIAAVNNCGLDATRPPMMPVYRSFRDIADDLSSTKQLTRGSKLFVRQLPYVPSANKSS